MCVRRSCAHVVAFVMETSKTGISQSESNLKKDAEDENTDQL